jgi:adenosine deaminase
LIGFSFDELARVAVNGFESSFLPYEERLQLVAEAEREIAALRGVDA